MDNWNENIVPPQEDAELKSIRKSLRKQNLKNVLTSLILAAALLLVSVYGIIPAVEKLYWGPYDSDYDAGSDLHLVLKANTELFHPGYKVQMLAGKSGFASYDLHITRTDDATGQKEYLNGTLSRGDLSLDYAYYDRGMEELYFHADYVQDLGNGEIYDIRDMWTEDAVELISQLPNYIQLKAIAFFPEDLNMEQFLQLLLKYNYDGRDGVSVIWTAVRVESNQGIPLSPIGFSVNSYNGYELNETYPEFFIRNFEEDGSHLAQHFKSLLQFSTDQVEKGKGISLRNIHGEYTQYVLEYVEEHGVNTYACLVSATPQGLQSMLDDGTASHLALLDSWIDVG